MSDRPLCYLNPMKSNNREMLTAFAKGSGAEITERLELVPGRPAVLYGVDRQTLPMWREIERTGHPYIYIDNGYMRSKWHGGSYYRITKNAPQCSGLGESTGERWRSLGLKIQPWRRGGTHILIACQSDFWHERHGHGNAKEFAVTIGKALTPYTSRPFAFRLKPIGHAASPLLEVVLMDCWAVVTHSSMVGLEAILAGVPVFAVALSALSAMSATLVSKIETPVYPGDRERWCGVLADNQWTISEVKDGTAWRAISG